MRRLWTMLALLGCLGGCLPLLSEAQGVPPCTKWRTNLKGSPSGTLITVSDTVVTTIADADNTRCYVIIVVKGANSGTCMAAGQGTPTATAGKILATNESIKLTSDSVEAIKCIGVGGTTTVEVTESIR